MKKIAFLALTCLVITMMSCNQAPIQQPKTSVFLISEGGGNDTTQTVSKSYERTRTDTMGIMHHSGKTTITSVTKKASNELKLIVTDTPQVQAQPQQTQAQPVTTGHISDWGMIAMILVIAALLGLLCYYLLHRTSASASASATVNIGRGCSIEDATLVDILNRRQDFRDRTLDIAEKAVDKGTLKSLFVAENPVSFTMGARFFKTGDKTTPPVKPADVKPNVDLEHA